MEDALSRIKHKHSRMINGRRHVWDVEKLWKRSENLPVVKIRVDSIQELDQDCWFGYGSTSVPTIRNVAKHCKRIVEADMSYPIIVTADGLLVDGGHRLAKALLNGQTEIDAVFLDALPDADFIEGAFTAMYRYVPMTEETARIVNAWTYPQPYDLYNMGGEDEGIAELLNGEYYSVREANDQIAGFICSGHSARIPGAYEAGIYNDPDCLDVGLGLRPDLTGKGLGSDYVKQAVEFLGKELGKSKFRLAVAAFNERAIRTYEKVGFRRGEQVHSPVSGVQVPFVVMRLTESG
ncbi:GNAT family N-acetyltransferase [Paenibacillus sp. GYB004]|uniref:GNAT family N-acetyltransferase n=1 Tax=Paenibacillus sp. GYB004 TaxID=2994393 RepID=UPI002F96E525